MTLCSALFWTLAGATVAQAASRTPFDENLTVHEWGTFTAVSGSDGRLLTGLEREEHALPPFVYSHAGFAPANKGWNRPVAGVTIKMETPVIYFYSPKPLRVSVEVAFRGGSISQWYPERAGGETLPSPPREPLPGSLLTRALFPAVDFTWGYAGSAGWKIDVLAPHLTGVINTRTEWETPQWPRARVPGANALRGPKGEVEGFIFYRGIGNFALPLRVSARAGGRLTLENTGDARIPFAYVYDNRLPSEKVAWSVSPHGTVATKWVCELRSRLPSDGHGPLGAGEARDYALEPPAASPGTQADDCGKALAAALLESGLTQDEAVALLDTWRASYFERPGLRVFWIVPRTFTDQVLPLSVSPRPRELVRVLVGRTEVLTPEFEAQLSREFAADGGKRWGNDRYALAYRERTRQLRVVSTAQHP